MVFLPILLNFASHVTRMMITEAAGDTAISLLGRLSDRKQFLGITGESVDNFITSKLSDDEATKRLANNNTLDFMMSFFPTDIDFKYLTKVDSKRNDWDDIAKLPEISEKDDVPFDFISFSGNNAVFENAVGNFETLLNDDGKEPFIKKELEVTKNKLWEIRSNLVKKGIKLLAHSNDNNLYIVAYHPEDIAGYQDDLEIYLKDQHYPFGALIAIVKIDSSINNRKVGLVENGFVNGNINSTFDLISSKLKVSPPMKAVIDDSYRKKILNDPEYSLSLRNEYGFVIDPEGNERLPNVTDYMFIPSAIMDVAETLNDTIVDRVKTEKSKLIDIITNYTVKASNSRFRGYIDRTAMREQMTNFMSSDKPHNYVMSSLKDRDVVLTLNGVKNFSKGWKDTYDLANNQGSAYVNQLNNLVIDLGFSSYGVSSTEERYWVSSYIKRMDNVPFRMGERRPTKMAEFFKGLSKIVKDLDTSNFLSIDNIDGVELVSEFVDKYEKNATYDLRTKKKIKNKNLDMVKKVLGVAVRIIGDGSMKAESRVNATDAPEEVVEEKNDSGKQDDILNDVITAK